MEAPPVSHYDVTYLKPLRPDQQHRGRKWAFPKVGRAWPGEDGKINLQLDSLPIGEWDGKLVLFPHASGEGAVP